MRAAEPGGSRIRRPVGSVTFTAAATPRSQSAFAAHVGGEQRSRTECVTCPHLKSGQAPSLPGARSTGRLPHKRLINSTPSNLQPPASDTREESAQPTRALSSVLLFSSSPTSALVKLRFLANHTMRPTLQGQPSGQKRRARPNTYVALRCWPTSAESTLARRKRQIDDDPLRQRA